MYVICNVCVYVCMYVYICLCIDDVCLRNMFYITSKARRVINTKIYVCMFCVVLFAMYSLLCCVCCMNVCKYVSMYVFAYIHTYIHIKGIKNI